MNFKIDIPNIANLIAAFRSAPQIVGPILVKYLNASEAILSSVTGQNTPYQSGRLITSFHLTPATTSSLIARWSPSANYALFVEQGTGIYGPTGMRIVPVNRKALANRDTGWGPFASTAGMQPRRYMEKIVAAATPQIQSLFESAGAAIVNALSS